MPQPRQSPQIHRTIHAANGGTVLAVAVAEYGLVGVCILVPVFAQPGIAQPGEFQFDTLLLSCRAPGRGIEETLGYRISPHSGLTLRTPE